ncbi:ATP-grasp domain-containing protein [Bacteroides congonensis]|uniref:ATP-grasp domain-containing protein n=1 Tax=Bacteroides congonensis TaxID=1871006 RepID=UPI00093378A0|nr:ATP-grasp domain-containing protein [Bacteroides congonensis]
MKSSILFSSAGRRGRLLRNAQESIGSKCDINATDNNATAPALYFATNEYIVPRINAPEYVDTLLDICKKANVKAITTLIDPEIEVLSANREIFLEAGVLPLCPADEITARCCFDKYEMFKYLTEKGIPTPLTYHDFDEFKKGVADGKISFPIFMKPICGSGSVGAHKVNTMEQAEADWFSGEHDYIIQELMTGGDCDADVYVDAISHKAVAAFLKRKIETRIGGASKTISYKDPVLFAFIEKIASVFKFCGPLDMDFFIKDGQYYLSEVNPRFGGAYLHAYGAGVDFFPLIWNNMNGIENDSQIGQYDEDVLMLMYDDVVIRKKSELVNDNFSIL